MQIGDLVRVSYDGASWIGVVTRIDGLGIQFYRGCLNKLQHVGMWQGENFYNMEVINESR